MKLRKARILDSVSTENIGLTADPSKMHSTERSLCQISKLFVLEPGPQGTPGGEAVAIPTLINQRIMDNGLLNARMSHFWLSLRLFGLFFEGVAGRGPP